MVDCRARSRDVLCRPTTQSQAKNNVSYTTSGSGVTIQQRLLDIKDDPPLLILSSAAACFLPLSPLALVYLERWLKGRRE